MLEGAVSVGRCLCMLFPGLNHRVVVYKAFNLKLNVQFGVTMLCVQPLMVLKVCAKN